MSVRSALSSSRLRPTKVCCGLAGRSPRQASGAGQDSGQAAKPRSAAQLLTADGRAKLYAPDDPVGPFTLTVVESKRVCLQRGSDEYWLELPQPGGTESSLAIRNGAP